jgi:hypothetical protein
MKSIKQQYIDLKEGKMSQANFMRNLRMSMPQVTNVTSFGDAVKILKNKGIITETIIKEELQEIKFNETLGPIIKVMQSLGYKGEYDPTIEEGYIFTKDFADGVMQILMTDYKPDQEKFTFTAVHFDRITKSQLFGLIKKHVIDYQHGNWVSKDGDVEIVDLGTGMFSLDKPGVEDLIKSMVKRVEEKAVATKGIDENYDYDKVGTDGYDNVSEKEKDEYPTPHVNSEEPNEDAEFDAMLKQIEDEMHGEEAVKAQYDETLNEAKEKTNPNKVHPQEYTMGIRYELKCFKGDVVKAERAVLKNLAKDPFYYTALKLSGKDTYQEAPAIKEEAPKKKAKKQAVELVDTVNAMQKVKMPKKEEKKKLKENVDAPHSIKADQEIDKSELNFLKKAYADRSTDKIPEKFKKIMQDLEDKIAAREKNEAMRFQDLPADSKKYKIVRDSKNYIIKATNADGVEFQKGDTAKTYDGEEIKIVKFEESQGKVKAIYNKGMFFAGIDIDGLEAPKATMRPGVDIGSSFEKMKAKLAEMVKKAMAEMYDGRDNLTNISDDTKD